MPRLTVADGGASSYPSASGDTPTSFNSPAIVAALVDEHTGRTRRKFPSPELLSAAAGLIPGVPAAANAGRSWAERNEDLALMLPGASVDVHQAADLDEGGQWYVSVSPGRVRVWTRDEARADRTENRAADLQQKAADALATWVQKNEQGMLEFDPPERTPTRQVTDWSAKSRVNMIGSYADLDFGPMFADPERVAAMLTFTYPRCWQTVAPNGRTVKAHMKKWRKRYERTFGEQLRCIWKLEFQGRAPVVYRDGQRVENWCSCTECAELEDGRAPHIHMLVTLPTSTAGDRFMPMDRFRGWLSTSWADVVAHPDPVEYAAHLAAGTRVDTKEGGRAADPRRIVTYFAKHGGAKAKEYQHCVPKRWQQPGQGPGRFWGYWGLEKAVQTVAVSPAVGTEAGRILRRHSRAQGVTRLTQRRRYRGGRADSKYPEVIGLAGAQLLAAHTMSHRPCRTRAVRAINGRGWSVVNDGANMGAMLGRALAAALDRREPAVVELEPDRPLLRALRLPPSPRRDALLARLRPQESVHQ